MTAASLQSTERAAEWIEHAASVSSPTLVSPGITCRLHGVVNVACAEIARTPHAGGSEDVPVLGRLVGMSVAVARRVCANVPGHS